MAQIAIAWSLTKVTAPIIGTTSLKNIEELAGMFPRIPIVFEYSSLYAAAVHIELTEEDIKALEEPYKPQAISGHY
jgi:hypothetical protein